jgi:uncharacterized sulfatase
MIKLSFILHKTKARFIEFCTKYFVYLLTILTFFVSIRVFELVAVSHVHNLGNEPLKIIFLAFRTDFEYVVYAFSLILIPGFTINLINSKAFNIFIIALFSILLIIDLSAIVYFLETSSLLDNIVFTLSLSDNWETITNQAGTIKYLFIITAIPILVILLNRFIIRKIKTHVLYSYLFILILCIIPCERLFSLKIVQFKNSNDYYKAENKLVYFLKTSFYYWHENRESDSISSIPNEDIALYQTTNISLQFIEKQYPFLHKFIPNDILAPLLTNKVDSPNFVFIIVEGLSRAISGNKAELSSFTPFLDSLADHSLYWKNCLSTSGRTFGVMPSIFGSLPYGKTGFMHLQQNMPDHNTIIKILKNNNYFTSCFYGAWYGFDNMNEFLKRQQNDLTIEYFPPKYKKIDADVNGFTWGYPDDVVYKRAAELIDSINPLHRLDIYLTVTSHESWIYPEKKKWQEKAKKLVLERFGEKSDNLNYTEQFGSFLYVDQSLKELFTYYKRRKDFYKTIFIITGDHRMWTPMNSPIDRYHVPLIIYSPMVIKPVKYESVVSHLSIAATFTSYFKNTLKFSVPQNVHWLLSELDTSVQFRSNISVPFMSANKDIEEYLDKDYFIQNDQIYRVLPELKMIQLNDSEKLYELKRKLKVFKQINSYICNFNKLYNGFLNSNTSKIILYSANIEKSFLEVKNQEYVNLIPLCKIPIGTKLVKFKLESQLVLPMNFDKLKMPYLVVDLWDCNNKSINRGSYLLDDIKININDKRSNIYSIELNLQFDLTQKYLEKADELRIYLYNGNKLNYKILIKKSEIRIIR